MYIVGLGSNLGSRFATLEAALGLLDTGKGCEVVARSLVYASAPMGPPQPHYLNAAVAVRSALDPEAMLGALLSVEAQLGRVRHERWGPRVLDLDLLWGPAPHASAALTLPHEGLSQRWFALAPLLDVAHAIEQSGAREQALLLDTARALHARYASQLAALGGAPVRGASFSSMASAASAQVFAEGDVRRLEAQGPLEDAVAGVLVGLGKLHSPHRRQEPCAPLAVHVVRVERAVENAVETILAAALQLLRSGFVIAHASVGADLAEVRVIGASDPAASSLRNARLETIEVITGTPREVRLRVECCLE